MRHLLVLLGLALTLTITSTADASAGLGVIPKQLDGTEPRSWFVHTLTQGEAKDDVLVINNSSSLTQTVMIEALDGLNVEEGAYTLVQSSSDNQKVGKWVQLETNSVTLKPNTSAEVKFRITVPPDAPVGEHSGGIVVYVKPPNEAENIQLKVRVGARIYITVPGTVRRDLQIEHFVAKAEGRKLTLDLRAINKSNVNLSPTIKFTLRGFLGFSTQTLEAPGIYLPNAPIQITYDWPRRLGLFGMYRITAKIHTNETIEYAADKSTKVLPDQVYSRTIIIWTGTVWVWLIFLGLLLAWTVKRYLDYKDAVVRYHIYFKPHTVMRGESIADIAIKYSLDIPEILKFNHLKVGEPVEPGRHLALPIRKLTSSELQAKRLREPYPNYWRLLLLIK